MNTPCLTAIRSNPASEESCFRLPATQVHQLVESIQPRITACPNGLVILFNRSGCDTGDDGTGYVLLPYGRHIASASAHVLHPSVDSPLEWLREILLRRFQASVDLHDNLTNVIAAAICLLSQSDHRYMLTVGRKTPGGLTIWQEQRATSFMEARLGDPINIEDVASHCGMSAAHFARAFRTTAGVPPYRWLLLKRIEASKHLLLTTSNAIVDISVECGFAEQSHFTHAFRREVGLAPGEWRRRNRGMAA